MHQGASTGFPQAYPLSNTSIQSLDGNQICSSKLSGTRMNLAPNSCASGAMRYYTSPTETIDIRMHLSNPRVLPSPGGRWYPRRGTSRQTDDTGGSEPCQKG